MNFSNTSLYKSAWYNWVVLKRTNICQLLLPQGSSHSRSCPLDIWCPLKGSCSCHLAHTPPVHLLGWVNCLPPPPPPPPPRCVLSNTTHVKTMSLTTFGFCSMVPSSTLHLFTIPKAFYTTIKVKASLPSKK